MRNRNACVSDPNSFISCFGDEFQIEYDSKVMPDGTIVLKPSGKIDIQEQINSFHDQTDIYYIVSRLAMGDTSVLSTRQPMYDDFIDAPRSLMEAYQTMIDGERAFYELPLDVREKFGNNFRNWLFNAGSPEWIKAMNFAEGSYGESDQKQDNFNDEVKDE